MKELALFLLAVVAAGPDQPWVRHTIDASSRGADGVRMADVNGDGRLDFVTGWEEGGLVRVYLNPGPTKTTRPWPAVTVGRVRAPEDAVLVDLDGDGAIDVVSCCEGNTQTVFVHWAPASSQEKYLQAEAWQTEAIPATAGKTRWMYALPLQLDGRDGIDLVVGSKEPGAMIAWLQAPKNPRDLGAWVLRPLEKADWIMSLVATDLDGDGDADVVASDRKGPRRRVLWLENPGSAGVTGSWRVRSLGAVGEEVMFLDVADLNGDRRNDVAAAAKPRNVHLLFQPAEPAGAWPSRVVRLPEQFGTSKAVRVADVILDGRQDLVVTCEQAAGEASGVLWLEGRDAPPRWLAHDIAGPEGVKYDLVELLDLDGDGDLDALTCEERDNLGVVWYENPTNPAGANRKTNE